MQRSLVTSLLGLALCACGGDGGGGDDGSNNPDAPPGTPDAAGSSVTVTANCTGIDDADVDLRLGTSGLAFVIEGQAPTNPPLTINAGDIIKFTSSGSHNFQNASGAPANLRFSSGSPGIHTACLQFNQAASVGYVCQVHGSMSGTITIN